MDADTIIEKGIDANEINNEMNGLNKNNRLIPDRITLSWRSITVKASNDKTCFKSPFKSHKSNIKKTILENVHGIVEPGQMVALIGARYDKT